MGNDPKEEAFRRALENLRYYACTDDDIALFRGCIPRQNPTLSLDDKRFKNVSIITALNRDKDSINDTCATRFADEHGQNLHSFYSVDSILSRDAVRPGFQSKRFSKAKAIAPGLQKKLWTQPPSTSEQIPACLRICVGMPILIRQNEATELCMTRGQEAHVVGWTALSIPGYPDHKRLDVLFVQLLNPPSKVQIAQLPINVVPLTSVTQSIDAMMPNDEYLRISRTQIPVLPNFAMTDYSSQGKSRQDNPVDIKFCKSFQGVYTCLSRGTSLSGTLIVRDFSDNKLRGQLDGALRQEY
ncbi:hypothetical protein BJ165DRAFT_1357087, partial [Panaeolus papilionaceus]